MCKVSAKSKVTRFCRAAAIFMQNIEADDRRFGNFEMDTIVGKKSLMTSRLMMLPSCSITTAAPPAR